MFKLFLASIMILLMACGGNTDKNGSNNNNVHTKIPVCGDGILDPGEACDEGGFNSDIAPNSCRTNCRYAYCGDGVVDDGEECDDANDRVGDGCHECVAETGWSCDERGCQTVCGDGLAVGEETCDGTDFRGRTCSTYFEGFRGNLLCSTDCTQISTAACTAPKCGDGVLDPGEVCDDGNNIDGDGCSKDCLSDETCGNSIIDTIKGETCDCGNDPNDLPFGCNGVNSMEPDATCRPDCGPARNGDLVIDPSLGEECDDNGLSRTDPNYEVDFGGLTCLDWPVLPYLPPLEEGQRIIGFLRCQTPLGSTARTIGFYCAVCGDDECVNDSVINCCTCPEDCGECPPHVTCP